LNIAARRYQATGNATFLAWADKELSWFLHSGMINGEYLVNDGLDKYGHNNNGMCMHP
jgi:hypothetical protein